jgi:hypothetical protein
MNELSFDPLNHAKAELKAIGDIMGLDKCDIFTGPLHWKKFCLPGNPLKFYTWLHMAFS